MVSLQTTIEDSSPLISYSPGWRAGHSSDDSKANLYSQSSFMVTNFKGESASFVFNGTNIEIYGAKRGNHGFYNVQLDDQSYPPSSGKTVGRDIFQEVLFSAYNLTQGLHRVTITNQEAQFLDIDFITWETTIGGSANDKLYAQTFQDTSPSFTYLPEADWTASPDKLGSFMAGSGRATTKSGASFIYSFDGDGVSLYGPIGLTGSMCDIQVDNGPPGTFTTRREFFTPQTLLYHASSLGPGTHKLTLTHRPNAPQQTFAIDYAIVYTTTAPSIPHSRKLTSLDIGLITATVISLTLLLVVSGAMLFWCRRKRRRERIESSPSVAPYLPVESPSPPLVTPVQTNDLSRRVYSKQKEGFGRVEYQPTAPLSTVYASTEYTRS